MSCKNFGPAVEKEVSSLLEQTESEQTKCEPNKCPGLGVSTQTRAAVPRGGEPERGLRLSGSEARGAGDRITHPRVCRGCLLEQRGFAGLEQRSLLVSDDLLL